MVYVWQEILQFVTLGTRRFFHSSSFLLTVYFWPQLLSTKQDRSGFYFDHFCPSVHLCLEFLMLSKVSVSFCRKV